MFTFRFPTEIRSQVEKLADVMKWANDNDNGCKGHYQISGNVVESCRQGINAIVVYCVGQTIAKQAEGGRYGWNLGGNADYTTDIEIAIQEALNGDKY